MKAFIPTCNNCPNNRNCPLDKLRTELAEQKMKFSNFLQKEVLGEDEAMDNDLPKWVKMLIQKKISELSK